MAPAETAVISAEPSSARLLTRQWPSLRAPVDPYVIARSLGIRVEKIVPPMDVSGKIAMSAGSTPTISINKRDPDNRQRFTCAHEIWHYMRNAPHRDRDFTDYRATLAGIGIDEEEIYANQFAAAIIMPALEVARLVNAGCDTHQMAQWFRTSEGAVTLRLKNLRLL